MRRSGWLVGLAFLLPAAAAAQPRVCVIDRDVDPPALFCFNAVDCLRDEDCPVAPTTFDGACSIVDHDVRYCAPGCSTIFECTEDGDCPVFDGTATKTPRCVLAPLTDPMGDAVSICEYDGVTFRVEYCSSSGPGSAEQRFLDCHTYEGVFYFKWEYGDCDGDGCQNAVDRVPCDETMGESCPRVPIETRCTLGNRDGGMPIGDAGPPPDAGVDAGDGLDAGEGLDAGHEPPTPGVRSGFRGRGAGCSSAGGWVGETRAAPIAGWPLAVLLLAIRTGSARRRRAGR